MKEAEMAGYTKIANFMSKYPESAQVLQFSDINLQNILYLQAEIYGLREDLRKLESQNRNSPRDDVQNFAFDWYSLAHTKDIAGQENKQWAKFRQLRMLLKEYSTDPKSSHASFELLMSKLPRPSHHDLHALQEWLRRPTLGGVYLVGRDSDIWSQGTDLISIGHRKLPNKLTTWIAQSFFPCLYRITGLSCVKQKNASSEFGTNFLEYPDTGISRIANLVGAVLASVLPVIAIIVLHRVSGIGIRLGLVAAFSALFSICLWFLNDGKMIEVFSTTSAFAAVQVVFVGTSGDDTSMNSNYTNPTIARNI